MFSCNVGVYVDDLIVTENGLDEVATFKEQMSSRFKMSDTGLLSFYLGIEVKHGSNGTTHLRWHTCRRSWNKRAWAAATHVTLQWSTA
jgi:hypothetical protein